ncbi:MAG: cyclodeaminase/cyclohydrolase family protein [Lachnospiraceae bacterium]|nr:cyclodeaminase/cyclohydrolase family protein [Lachnospiraceae bacterium]
MENLSEKSCIDFAEALASNAPVPGGGGAAALAGALGVALCSMVGNITKGRKKYAEYLSDYERMLKECEKIRENLLSLIDEDAKAFEPLQKAYSIPKDDPNREKIMNKVSIDACTAPLSMMRNICLAIELLEEMYEKGSILLISDIGCGALLSGAALKSASMNIFVNTKSLPIELAGDLEKETKDMLETYIPRAELLSDKVMERLKRQ